MFRVGDAAPLPFLMLMVGGWVAALNAGPPGPPSGSGGGCWSWWASALRDFLRVRYGARFIGARRPGPAHDRQLHCPRTLQSGRLYVWSWYMRRYNKEGLPLIFL